MSQPSKRQRFSAATTATNNVSAMVENKANDTGTFLSIPVSSVIPDPNNHRLVKLDWDNPEFIAEDDPQAEAKQAELEDLRQMAKSIGKDGVGLINPILVMRRGDSYQLIAGYRRTLASKLAGAPTVKANIRTKVLTRLAQHVENAQRRDISFPELLISLRGVLQEIGIAVVAGIKHTQVQQALENEVGYGRIQAYRLAVILVGSGALHDAIESGRVTSIIDAAELAKLSEDDLATELLAREAGPSLLPAQDDRNEGGTGQVAATRSSAPSRRTKDYVSLGKVRDMGVVKILMEKVLGDRVPTDINWNDTKSVTKAFKKMLEQLTESAK